MPRKVRQISESGIYHVMLRGINRQQFFEEEEDYLKFIEVLKTYKEICGYEVFAYCLMGNHVHLLLKVGKEDLPIIFRRIGGSFVYWYNWKYQRSGHLFQDRYKSEPVEDDAYLLTVARYIHQNPVKAGLCKNPGGYAYSSYNEYIDIKKTNLADPEFLLEIIGKDEFIKYHQTENRDACLETGGTMRPPDKEAQKIIKKITGCGNQSEFQKLDPKNIDLYIKKLREKGLSIRQINRLTGVSYAVARKN